MKEVLTEVEKSNNLLDNTGNRPESGTQVNDHQEINTSFDKGLWLEDKNST